MHLVLANRNSIQGMYIYHEGYPCHVILKNILEYTGSVVSESQMADCPSKYQKYL